MGWVAIVVVLLLVTPRVESPSAAAAEVIPTTSASPPVGPLVFFRTLSRKTGRPLRSVERLDARTGRQLASVTLPTNLRTFVDATQVGGQTFVAWTTKRGNLWLARAGEDGRINRRWPVGRAEGFEHTPTFAEYDQFLYGSGFLRVTANESTALLVSGDGSQRTGYYVNLHSGATRAPKLPSGLETNVADIAVLGNRFVLVGDTAALVTVGVRGNVVARGAVKFPTGGETEIGNVNLVGLSGGTAVVSFVTGGLFDKDSRRFVVRYDARTGSVKITNAYREVDGEQFVATAMRFAVFGYNRWTTGLIDGGPIRKTEPPPGPDPDAPPVLHDPAYRVSVVVLDAASSTDQHGFVLRYVRYESQKGQHDTVAFEVIDVDVDQEASVVRRIRFGVSSYETSPLPDVFDIRIS